MLFITINVFAAYYFYGFLDKEISMNNIFVWNRTFKCFHNITLVTVFLQYTALVSKSVEVCFCHRIKINKNG